MHPSFLGHQLIFRLFKLPISLCFIGQYRNILGQMVRNDSSHFDKKCFLVLTALLYRIPIHNSIIHAPLHLCTFA